MALRPMYCKARTCAAAHAVDHGAAEAACSRVLQAGVVGRRQRGATHLGGSACRELGGQNCAQTICQALWALRVPCGCE